MIIPIFGSAIVDSTLHISPYTQLKFTEYFIKYDVS